ncbi:hypothetical protein BCR36DRAFT_149753 [Piromyces finnis]|uniref:Uncharacterized protein n=1 Tax=Piromyces finnis TaxID=1754191 RepID=A0A1Y1UYI4_9FUNG|nr:hypothetical protein BCR36DRAFT_149753 [Piromyces finnis]|eukprot:ORX42822.1 hypothetical protein BCR36DRAFT_149753 [Piromyces finnis]
MVDKINSAFPSWISYQLIPSDFGCFTGERIFNKNSDKLTLETHKSIKKIYTSSNNYIYKNSNIKTKLNCDYYRSNYGSAYVPDKIINNIFEKEGQNENDLYFNANTNNNLIPKNLLTLYQTSGGNQNKTYLISVSGTYDSEISFYNFNKEKNDEKCHLLSNNHPLKFKNSINQITNVVSQNGISVFGVKLPDKVSFIQFDLSSTNNNDNERVYTSFFGHYQSLYTSIASIDINRYQIEEAVITENDGIVKLFNINTQSHDIINTHNNYTFNDCAYMNHPKLLLYTNNKSINLLDSRIPRGCNSREINVLFDPNKNFFISKPHPINVKNVYTLTENEILLHDIRYSKHPLLSINHNYGDNIPNGMDITPTYYNNLASDMVFLWNSYTGASAINIIHPYSKNKNNETQYDVPFINHYNFSIESYNQEHYSTKELLSKKQYLKINSEDLIHHSSPLKGFTSLSSHHDTNTDEIHIFQLSDRGNIFYNTLLVKCHTKSTLSNDAKENVSATNFSSSVLSLNDYDKNSKLFSVPLEKKVISPLSKSISQLTLVNEDSSSFDSFLNPSQNNTFDSSSQNTIINEQDDSQGNQKLNINNLLLLEDESEEEETKSMKNDNHDDLSSPDMTFTTLSSSHSRQSRDRKNSVPSLSLSEDANLENTVNLNNLPIDKKKPASKKMKDKIEVKTSIEDRKNFINNESMVRDRMAYSSQDYTSLYQYLTKDTLLPRDISSIHGFIQYFNREVIQHEVKDSVNLMKNNIMVKSLNEIHQRLSDHDNQYSSSTKTMTELPEQNYNPNIDWTNPLFRKEFNQLLKKYFPKEKIIKINQRFLPFKECDEDLVNFFKLRESLDIVLPNQETFQPSDSCYDENGQVSGHEALKNFIAYSIWSASQVCNPHHETEISHESIYRMIHDYLEELSLNQVSLDNKANENKDEVDNDNKDKTISKKQQFQEHTSDEFQALIEAFSEYEKAYNKYKNAKRVVSKKEKELGVDLISKKYYELEEEKEGIEENQEGENKDEMNNHEINEVKSNLRIKLKTKHLPKEKKKLRKKWKKKMKSELRRIRKFDREVLPFVKRKLFVSELSPYVIPISEQTRILLSHYEHENLVLPNQQKGRESKDNYSDFVNEKEELYNNYTKDSSLSFKKEEKNPWAYLENIDLDQLIQDDSENFKFNQKEKEDDEFLSYMKSQNLIKEDLENNENRMIVKEEEEHTNSLNHNSEMSDRLQENDINTQLIEDSNSISTMEHNIRNMNNNTEEDIKVDTTNEKGSNLPSLQDRQKENTNDTLQEIIIRDVKENELTKNETESISMRIDHTEKQNSLEFISPTPDYFSNLISESIEDLDPMIHSQFNNIEKKISTPISNENDQKDKTKETIVMTEENKNKEIDPKENENKEKIKAMIESTENEINVLINEKDKQVDFVKEGEKEENRIEIDEKDEEDNSHPTTTPTIYQSFPNIFNTEQYKQLLLHHPDLCNIHINTQYLSILFDISLLGMNYFNIEKKSNNRSRSHSHNHKNSLKPNQIQSHSFSLVPSKRSYSSSHTSGLFHQNYQESKLRKLASPPSSGSSKPMSLLFEEPEPNSNFQEDHSLIHSKLKKEVSFGDGATPSTPTKIKNSNLEQSQASSSIPIVIPFSNDTIHTNHEIFHRKRRRYAF